MLANNEVKNCDYKLPDSYSITSSINKNATFKNYKTNSLYSLNKNNILYKYQLNYNLIKIIYTHF